MKVYIEKRQTKDKKNEYLVLYIDFGYAELPLSFKPSEIAEFSNLRVSDIAKLVLGDKLEVATYNLVNE